MRDDYIIYTGNSYPHKNLGRLIDAILEVKIKLKIVSARNIFIERLQNEIKSKKASRYVEILGFVSDEKLKKLYKNAKAFVFPTLSEGFGLPPKEAIEAGTIAVVSDIPVLKEIYEDSVFYFDPLSVASIADAISKVLKMSKAQRGLKIKSAQKFVKKYSWAKMAKETLKIYEFAIK